VRLTSTVHPLEGVAVSKRGLMWVQIFYAWDDIEGQEQIIIVEGEIDKLSLEEAGYQNATSVPAGAPAAVKEGPLPIEEQDKRFSYLYNRCPLDDLERPCLWFS